MREAFYMLGVIVFIFFIFYVRLWCIYITVVRQQSINRRLTLIRLHCWCWRNPARKPAPTAPTVPTARSQAHPLFEEYPEALLSVLTPLSRHLSHFYTCMYFSSFPFSSVFIAKKSSVFPAHRLNISHSFSLKS